MIHTYESKTAPADKRWVAYVTKTKDPDSYIGLRHIGPTEEAVVEQAKVTEQMQKDMKK